MLRARDFPICMHHDDGNDQNIRMHHDRLLYGWHDVYLSVRCQRRVEACAYVVQDVLQYDPWRGVRSVRGVCFVERILFLSQRARGTTRTIARARAAGPS